MARYLQNKEKFAKYRVVADYNRLTNDYHRDKNGNLDDSFDDIYIRCSKGSKIYHYGKGVLMAYVSSRIRGKNILNSLSPEIAFDIEETESELLFKFKYKDLEEVATLLKAHVNQINKDGEYNYISPFSTRNLPKIKINIPADKLEEYKELVSKLGENSMLIIKDINNNFIKSLSNKKWSLDDIKADMKLKCAKGKDYFYLIEKFDDYLEYIKKHIK